MSISNEELEKKCKSNAVISAAKSAIIQDDINEFLIAGGEIEIVEGFKGVAKFEKIYTRKERKKQAFESNKQKQV